MYREKILNIVYSERDMVTLGRGICTERQERKIRQ